MSLYIYQNGLFFQKITTPNAGKHATKVDHSYIADGNVKFPLQKKKVHFSIKSKHAVIQ